MVLQWTEWKEERGGGGVYIEEQEEGERVEFSNIWNQSVCKRRGEQGGWIWGGGTEKRERKRKERTEEMKNKARDRHTQEEKEECGE